ncbi:hypothetical protein [Hymenobacter sp. BRD67]|uniref:hypothetical protein n=1 Tax=Hymenobacter sp. BRD67 TaxID=2675877 RepID=UPI00156383D8|nr:hypothetical protein [Hymenobacter sp. BRD67]QKG51835.1 hypothetical protein GKZ67_03470 [Hymenobacter sp. BRD67]
MAAPTPPPPTPRLVLFLRRRWPSGPLDSLNGIPSYHFGEPLSAFPGLKEGESNIEGMRRYYYPSDQANHGSG